LSINTQNGVLVVDLNIQEDGNGQIRH
jgi:hypothetical protein